MFGLLSFRPLVLLGRDLWGFLVQMQTQQQDKENSSSESAFPLKMLLSLVTVRSVGGGLLFSAIVELIRMKNDGESDQRHKGCQKRKPMRYNEIIFSYFYFYGGGLAFSAPVIHANIFAACCCGGDVYRMWGTDLPCVRPTTSYFKTTVGMTRQK